MTRYSELLQISRDGWAASRAARSAASAASRAARAAARSNAPGASRAARSAASRSALSAAADAAEAARGASCIRWFEYPEVEEERRRIRTGTVPPRAPRELVPGVDVTDKDLESDEATWALYEQWCEVFNKLRERSEMERRFHMFKRTAASVLSCNEAEAREGMPANYTCLVLYADGLDAQDIVESAMQQLKRLDMEDLLSLVDNMSVELQLLLDQSPEAHESCITFDPSVDSNNKL